MTFQKKFMIIIEGPMGAGKTTVAEILHKKLPRTALLGLDKIKFFLSDFKRGREDNILSFHIVYSMMEAYLKEGCNILFPQAFWKRHMVEKYIELARKYNADVYFYQFEAPRDTLMDRITKRSGAGGLHEITEGIAEKNFTIWEENRYELGKNIDTTKHSVDEIVNIILKDLETGSNIVH